MFGPDVSFAGSMLAAVPPFQKAFGLESLAETKLSSNINSTFYAGALFGTLFGFFITERFGRKWALLLSWIAFGVDVAMKLELHGSLGLMYSGSTLMGVAVGTSSLVVPICIAEAAPATIRNRLIQTFSV